MALWQKTLARVLEGGRLSDEGALEILQHADLTVLGQAADEIRRRKHPRSLVTFIIDRNINYTNICVSKCRFCAFYREASAPDAYLLCSDVLQHKVTETIAAGGTQIMLQGGLHPNLGLPYFEKLLRAVKSRHDITL
ncbi:MAG: radical SAM protein, partial [Bacillota bacterium]